jgi:ABC-type amino acid transport substrate-binding protein
VTEALRTDLGLKGLTVEWVPVTLDDRFRAVQAGRVDLLCAADTVTLARRADVSFSIPIFPGGVGAIVRGDAPARLRQVLSGQGQTFTPTWRASASQAIQARSLTAVSGTTGERWLGQRVRDLQVLANVSAVESYDAGISRLLGRESDVLFGERAILLDAARRRPSAGDLVVIDRLFTDEPLALAMARGDDDFRLAVDRALSRFYRSGALGELYTTSFGEPDQTALTFFRWHALPE